MILGLPPGLAALLTGTELTLLPPRHDYGQGQQAGEWAGEQVMLEPGGGKVRGCEHLQQGGPTLT